MDYWEQKIASMSRTACSIGSVTFFVVAILACADKREGQLPYYNSPDFTPLFIDSKESADAKINHTIANFSFMDQHGKSITEQNVEGRIHVANFIFTSCGSICPVMTEHMKLVQKRFYNNPNVLILSYSVTPWIDDVKRLSEYATENGITSPQWHLLTGNQSEVYELARRSYFAEEDIGYTRDSTEFLHTEHVLLIDGSKKIRGIYNGTLQLEIEQMIADINVLLTNKELF